MIKKIGYHTRISNRFVKPFGYIKYWENPLNDDWYYCIYPIYPIMKIWSWITNKGIKIGPFLIYLYIPTWNQIKSWKFYKRIAQGQVSTGAFFTNRSNMIYGIHLPPLTIKFYKK